MILPFNILSSTSSLNHANSAFPHLAELAAGSCKQCPETWTAFRSLVETGHGMDSSLVASLRTYHAGDKYAYCRDQILPCIHPPDLTAQLPPAAGVLQLHPCLHRAEAACTAAKTTAGLAQPIALLTPCSCACAQRPKLEAIGTLITCSMWKLLPGSHLSGHAPCMRWHAREP